MCTLFIRRWCWIVFSCLFADRGKGAGPRNVQVCLPAREDHNTRTACLLYEPWAPAGSQSQNTHACMVSNTQPEHTDWADRRCHVERETEGGKIGGQERRTQSKRRERERKRWGLLPRWLDESVTVTVSPDLAAIRLAVCLLFFCNKKCIDQCACCR